MKRQEKNQTHYVCTSLVRFVHDSFCGHYQIYPRKSQGDYGSKWIPSQQTIDKSYWSYHESIHALLPTIRTHGGVVILVRFSIPIQIQPLVAFQNNKRK